MHQWLTKQACRIYRLAIARLPALALGCGLAVTVVGGAAADCLIEHSEDPCRNGCPGHVVYVVNQRGTEPGTSVSVRVERIAIDPGKRRQKSYLEYDLDVGERAALGCSTEKSEVMQCVVTVHYKVRRCN